jgi:hypothetical protein
MPTENEAPPSVADSLTDAIDQVESQTPAPSDPPAVAPQPQEAPAAEPGAAPAAQERTTERQRGPDGKFVRREGDAPPPVPAPAAEPGAQPPVAPAAAPADAAPAGWTPAAKAKWGTLDTTVKGEIAKREREIAVGMQRAAEVRQFGDSLAQEFAPYANILAQEGATPQGALRALLETVHTLRYGSDQHKHALFLSLAQQYGIDMQKQIDPEKARLQWELDSRNINDQRQQVAQQQALQRDVTGELEQFISAPGHEHYGAVRMAMAGLMQTGMATNLQDAYDRACWSDPNIRSALQLAENAKRVAAQAKNRNALGAVNGGPGAVGVAPGIDPRNLRSLLESQFEGTAGRV